MKQLFRYIKKTLAKWREDDRKYMQLMKDDYIKFCQEYR